MAQVVNDNPVVDFPYADARCCRIDAERITDETSGDRRMNSHLVPTTRPEMMGQGIEYGTKWARNWTGGEEDFNRIHALVSLRRMGRYPGVTQTTRHLLECRTGPDRGKRSVFSQMEACEAPVCITSRLLKNPCRRGSG